VEAIKQGAYDYVSKPIDPQRLKILLDQIVARHDTLREVRVLRRQLQEHGRFGRLIGASREMRKIYQVIEQAAPTSTSVLVSGESGTGKELVAQTIHQLSPRAAQPFVPINCAAIPDTLLESELFGHEKGAFTGAIARRQGCFELANHGTLFLDEIAEMTPVTQAKLLRVLQERTFRTLGGQREQKVDVRVIAATNVDPLEAVRQGKLREDLFYRLNVFGIALPPLRERKDDLPLLVDAFIREFNERNHREVAGVSPRVMAILERYDWPGNVRELRNVMERATIVTRGPLIEPGDLPTLAGVVTAPGASAAPPGGLTPGTTVDDMERRLIEVTLEHTNGNKTRAAEMLGISLKTLHNKLNRMKARQGP
jgi:DNA-binding NtrC family response regulator